MIKDADVGLMVDFGNNLSNIKKPLFERFFLFMKHGI